MTIQRLRAVPLELARSNGVVARIHRHSPPVAGHRFSIGAIDDAGSLRGVAINGRPSARGLDPSQVLEVLRVATDGCPNACSFLYGASARAAQAIGFWKAVTYTRADEPGTSLRAAGWTHEATVRGRHWTHTDGAPRRVADVIDRIRWARVLNPPLPTPRQTTIEAA